MKKSIVVITGIHSSGKTRLGNLLQHNGFVFFSEIGSELRKETTKNVSQSQIDFDLHVMEMEIKRDQRIVSLDSIAVIETWHVGNIAFAESRGSISVATEYRRKLYEQLERIMPIVIKLDISDTTFLQRASEKNISPSDALTFYRKVEQNLDRLLDELSQKELIKVISCTDYNLEELICTIRQLVD